MNKTEKQQLVADLHEQFSRATVMVATGFQGLTVEEMSALRRRLREAKGEIRVIKNSLARRAMEDTAAKPLADSLSGPVAVTLGYADPISPVKALVEFAQRDARLTLLGAVVEAQFIAGSGIKRLATLPSRTELLARVASRLNAPVHGLVAVLGGTLRRFVATVAAIRDTRSKSGPEDLKIESKKTT